MAKQFKVTLVSPAGNSFTVGDRAEANRLLQSGYTEAKKSRSVKKAAEEAPKNQDNPAPGTHTDNR